MKYDTLAAMNTERLLQAREAYAYLLRSVVQDRAGSGWEYTLARDVRLPLPPDLPPPALIETRWMATEPSEDWGGYLMLPEGYSWDGCTYVPDFSRGATLSRVLHTLNTEGVPAALGLCGPLIGSAYHDPIYQYARDISKAAGMSRRRVLRWGDDIFLRIMQLCATPRLQRLSYYAGVRALGWVFNSITGGR